MHFGVRLHCSQTAVLIVVRSRSGSAERARTSATRDTSQLYGAASQIRSGVIFGGTRVQVMRRILAGVRQLVRLASLTTLLQVRRLITKRQ